MGSVAKNLALWIAYLAEGCSKVLVANGVEGL